MYNFSIDKNNYHFDDFIGNPRKISFFQIKQDYALLKE